MIEHVVSSVVARLGDLLTQEAKLLSGMEGQVKCLQEELRRMQGFLKDVDATQDIDEDEFTRDLLSEIRNAVYAAEDAVEIYALKSASNRSGSAINVLKQLAGIYTDHEFGSEIEAIIARISNLIQRLQTTGMRVTSQDEGSSSLHERQREQRRCYSHIVVGIEKNVEELATYLVAEETDYPVVSIWCMSGFGKSTLSKQVYHHSKVRRHFNRFAWVNLDQQYKTRDVRTRILFSLISPIYDEEIDQILSLSDEVLTDYLYRVLQEYKCLVVLADVSSFETLESLLPSFPYEKGNKILLTTSPKEVTLHADPRGIIHEPPFLDDEASWKLLQKILRSGRDSADFNIDNRMEELGKRMVNLCCGLPWAITMLGGILATKFSSNEWQMVDDNVKSYYRRRQEVHPLQLIRTLSYVNLPTWLKPCLLYLSQFPKEYEINVNKLLRLWIAEGFVPPVTDTGEEEEMLEDVAECYLNELVQRGMVLVGERDESLRIKTCHLHDHIRYLCSSKAEHESFHSIIKYDGNKNVDTFSLTSTSCRGLAVHLHGPSCQFPLGFITSPNLKSLLCFYDFSHERWRLLKPVFENLKLLRVLDLEGADIGEGTLLKDIGELIYLRFLSLRHARVSKIPSSIGNLRYLQTLDLLIEGTIVHVPNVIWKMERLRHLYLPEFCEAKTKLRLDNLINLRTLVNFPAQNCDVRDLFSMTNLRELTIRDPLLIKNFMRISKSLSMRLKYLRALSLDSSHQEDDTEATKFKDLRSMSFGDYI